MRTWHFDFKIEVHLLQPDAEASWHSGMSSASCPDGKGSSPGRGNYENQFATLHSAEELNTFMYR